MRSIVKTCLVLGLLSVTACGAGAGAGGDAEAEVVGTQETALTPVAQLELSNGSVIGWYEVFPGVVVVGEKFRTSQTPAIRSLDVAAFSPTGLFQALGEGQEVPRALFELEDRVANTPATDPSALAAARGKEDLRPEVIDRDLTEIAASKRIADAAGIRTAEGVGVTQQAAIDESACPHDWFFSQDVANCDGGTDWIVARSFRSGVNNFTHDDNDWAFGGACSYRGLIHHRVRYAHYYSWSNWVDVTLNTGEGWLWDRSNYSNDFDIDVRVDQADGDGYHVCASGFD